MDTNTSWSSKKIYSNLSECPLLVSPIQALIGTDSIPNLHKLEQVSSDEGIGTLAENLLEALREHAEVNLKIDAARRETRAEKKRMAMAMRQKALGTLGMTVLEGIIAKKIIDSCSSCPLHSLPLLSYSLLLSFSILSSPPILSYD